MLPWQQHGSVSWQKGAAVYVSIISDTFCVLPRSFCSGSSALEKRLRLPFGHLRLYFAALRSAVHSLPCSIISSVTA